MTYRDLIVDLYISTLIVIFVNTQIKFKSNGILSKELGICR